MVSRISWIIQTLHTIYILTGSSLLIIQVAFIVTTHCNIRWNNRLRQPVHEFCMYTVRWAVLDAWNVHKSWLFVLHSIGSSIFQCIVGAKTTGSFVSSEWLQDVTTYNQYTGAVTAVCSVGGNAAELYHDDCDGESVHWNSQKPHHEWRAWCFLRWSSAHTGCHFFDWFLHLVVPEHSPVCSFQSACRLSVPPACRFL